MPKKKPLRANRIPDDVALALFRKHNLEPLVAFPGTQKPWKSRCVITGKTVSPTYGKVRDFGHRCIYCSRQVVDQIQAIKLMKSRGLIPQVPFPGTNSPWKCECVKCKKVSTPTYWNVAKGSGCKFCGGRAVDPKDAERMMRQRGFKTLEPFPGSENPWKVRCQTCSKEFSTRFYSSRSKNRCKYCQKTELDPTKIKNTLDRLGLISLVPFPGARKPWRLQCQRCKRSFDRKYEKLTRKDRKVRGCSFCSRKRVDPTDAVQKMLESGVEPLIPYPGGKKPWKCRCLTCKNIVYPRWDDVGQGQGACSNCADYGLNYSLPGYLYLITNPKLNSHKIGIANSYKSIQYDDRMYQHQKRGWVLYKKRNFAVLRQAKKVEQEILRWVRSDLEIPVHLGRREMPQGGWTETVDAEEINLPLIWKKVEELSKNRG